MASVTVSHPLKSINAQLPYQSCSHATYALRFADPSLTSEALRHEDSRSVRPIENGDANAANSVQIPKYQMDPNGARSFRYDNLGNKMT